MRSALVTGGTDGIGKATARVLARAGYRLALVGRDPEKGAAAVREIRAATGNTRVEFLRADLSLTRGAEELAERVADRFDALHVLFHSAGGISFERRLTSEGHEWNFALNYLTRFTLTERLLPLLSSSGRPGQSARIIAAGGAIRSGTIHYDDATLASNFAVMRSVTQVQIANDVWLVELARRLAKAADATGAGPNITTACLKFGAVRTGIRRAFPPWARFVIEHVIDPVVGRTAEEAGAAAAILATDPALEGVSGALFEFVTRLRRLQPGRRVRDPAEGRRLWELSERLQGAAAPA